MPRIDLLSGSEAPSRGLRALDGWLSDLDPDLADRVRIAAGELLGNAVEHGPGGMFSLEWHGLADGGVLRLRGGGNVTPAAIREARLPAPDATGGRGLFILRAVADALSVEHDGTLRLDFEL